MLSNRRDTLRPGGLGAFVDALQAKGQYRFRKADAAEALPSSETALRAALRRLERKGRIACPKRGFYVIVPLEYRQAGAPPASWFIDDLMRFQRLSYYVCLLTAASLHGASHLKPQEFEVLVEKPLRSFTVGRVRVRFFTKRRLEKTPVMSVKTETGAMRVSTPEATALDMIRYARSVGHLGNVVTALADLAASLDGKRLVEAAAADVDVTCVQRLGYVLEHLGFGAAVGPLAEWVGTARPRITLLNPGGPAKPIRRDDRWMVLVNQEVEPER